MSSNSEPSEGIGELQMDLTSDVKHDEKLEVQELPSSDHPATPEELDGDEALKLVGAQRKDSDVFSDEYNAVLKRKLDWLIPPIAGAVYFTQFLDKNALSYARCLLIWSSSQRYANMTIPCKKV
jgi:ACS family allantoate permease-like MFS transporter